MTDPSSYCKAAPDDSDPEGSPPHDPQVVVIPLDTHPVKRICRWCGRVWTGEPS